MGEFRLAIIMFQRCDERRRATKSMLAVRITATSTSRTVAQPQGPLSSSQYPRPTRKCRRRRGERFQRPSRRWHVLLLYDGPEGGDILSTGIFMARQQQWKGSRLRGR